MNFDRINAGWPRLCAALLFAAGVGHAQVIRPTIGGGALVETGRLLPSPPRPQLPAPPPADVLEFLNGDVLRGQFVSLTTDGGLRWQHAAAPAPFTVRPGAVAELRFKPGPTNAPRGHESCRVWLWNNDELLGDLVALDDRSLQLETWYAGTLTIPRPAIRAVIPGLEHLAVVYDSPTNLADWNPQGNTTFANVRVLGGQVIFMNGNAMQNMVEPSTAWKYQAGAFYTSTSGQIARDVNLPPRSNIEFDLEWSAGGSLEVFLYADGLTTFTSSAYALRLGYGSLQLDRWRKNIGQSPMERVDMTNRLARPQVRVSIRTDKSQKTIAVLLDGEVARQWTDDGDFAGGGTGLIFNHVLNQIGAVPLKISNLRITEWDGRLDAPALGAALLTEDTLSLANQDKITGQVKAYYDGKLSLTTEFATLDVPLNRILLIEFAGRTNAPPPAETNLVRALFASHGAVTFSLDHWSDRRLAARSANFGAATFDAAAFTRVRFNLEREAESRDDDFSDEAPPGAD